MPSFPYEELSSPVIAPKQPWLPMLTMYARKQIRRKSVVIMLLLANIPTIVAFVFIYLIGQGKTLGGPFADAIPAIDLALARPWIDIYFTAAAILTAIIGPGAVAGERRAGATHFHIIRPMTSWEFLFGHWLVVLSILMFVTLVPLSLIFIFAKLVLSADLLSELPWIDLVRVFGFSFGISGYMSIVVIALSSVGSSSRSVTMLWLLTFFGTNIMAGIARGTGLLGEYARLISLPDNLRQFSSLILEGKIRYEDSGYYALLVLGIVVLISLFLLWKGARRIEQD